jgi:phosphate uptake regulator
MDIKKTLTENRTLLSEAVAVLRLIDHAEEADAITLRTASRAARRLVETVNDQLEELDIEIGREGTRIGTFHYPLSGAADEQGIAAIKRILENCCDSCLFMTSHFTYGAGTRILTLSNKKPLSIIYKEIGCMRIQLD